MKAVHFFIVSGRNDTIMGQLWGSDRLQTILSTGARLDSHDEPTVNEE